MNKVDADTRHLRSGHCPRGSGEQGFWKHGILCQPVLTIGLVLRGVLVGTIALDEVTVGSDVHCRRTALTHFAVEAAQSFYRQEQGPAIHQDVVQAHHQIPLASIEAAQRKAHQRRAVELKRRLHVLLDPLLQPSLTVLHRRNIGEWHGQMHRLSEALQRDSLLVHVFRYAHPQDFALID